MVKRMALLRSLLLVAFVGFVMAYSPVSAQTLVREFDAAEAGKYVVINADSLTYDENLGTVTASGNVEISQGHRLLIADTVSYNEGQDMMT